MTLTRCLFGSLAICFALPSFAMETIDDPCGGESALLNLVDRPTVSDSACAVPFKQAIVELGYQYQKVSGGNAHQQNLPEAEFRVGLPERNELSVVLPNYTLQSVRPHSGFGLTTVGLKHEIGFTASWLGAVETLVTLPTGSAAFGSRGMGVALNGVVEYTFTPKWSVLFELGVSSLTAARLDGGQRFTTVNPDVVLTYVLNQKVNFYAELYGQSKTGAKQISGCNVDVGVLFLPRANVEMDVEVGQRVYGQLSGFDHYMGVGMSLLI